MWICIAIILPKKALHSEEYLVLNPPWAGDDPRHPVQLAPAARRVLHCRHVEAPPRVPLVRDKVDTDL